MIGSVTVTTVFVKPASRAYVNVTVVACDCGFTTPVIIWLVLLMIPLISFPTMVGGRPGAMRVLKVITSDDEIPAELKAKIL